MNDGGRRKDEIQIISCHSNVWIYFVISFFFHAASTSASRSGVRPAFGCDCRSGGSDLNQASVSLAVTSSGRNVRALLNARLMFVRATASSLPVHTGMSDQGCTFCSVKNSSFTQINFASDFKALLIPSSIPAMPNGLAGPLAL